MDCELTKLSTNFSTIYLWYLRTSIASIWFTPHVDYPNELHFIRRTYEFLTGAQQGKQVFGQDPLWLAWVTDLINLKDAGNLAQYNELLSTVTPARFKVGQMIGSTGILMGLTLAMYINVDEDKKKLYKGIFLSSALAVFLTGVTEPIEYMFMFVALPLYIVYALVQGCAFAMADIVDLRVHSFGNIESL